VTSVSWSPDGSKIASGYREKTVRVWDSSTGAVLSTLEGHSNWVNSVSWSSDGSKIDSKSKQNGACMGQQHGRCAVHSGGTLWNGDFSELES
jgi:WD40 repeat protein